MKRQVTTIEILHITLYALFTLSLPCLLFGCGAKQVNENTESTVQTTVATEPAVTEAVISMPWDEAGAKQPADYTWEEYEMLTGEQQEAFKVYLGVDAYGKWLDSMRAHADVKPWDELGAKQPEEYSWAEYEALAITHQIAFQNYLGQEAFSAWLSNVQGQMEAKPWDEPGAKQPADYTLEDFEALSAAHQMLFQYSLGVEGFDNWLNSVQNQTEAQPWDEPGAKQPVEYTWKEFDALTAAQQMAFQNALGTDGFEEWMSQAQDQSEIHPWETSWGKKPENYTWKEFEALTAAQQMAFQNVLGTDGFEEWMNQAQNQGVINPWERSGAKQPVDYTWREFEKLTAAQQIAFQNVLGTDGFEEWMNQAQDQGEINPWEKSGAKQPADYTWQEFEALTGAQQMAFQNELGPDGFEAWLNQAEGQ